MLRNENRTRSYSTRLSNSSAKCQTATRMMTKVRTIALSAARTSLPVTKKRLTMATKAVTAGRALMAAIAISKKLTT